MATPQKAIEQRIARRYNQEQYCPRILWREAAPSTPCAAPRPPIARSSVADNQVKARRPLACARVRDWAEDFGGVVHEGFVRPNVPR